MRRSSLVLIAAALLATACGSRHRPTSPVPAAPPSTGDATRIGDTIRVQIEERGRRVVRDVRLDDYAAAAALSEFAPAAGTLADVERMFEVQTIISRTYAVAHRGRHTAEGFDLCSTTHCQVYEPGRLDTSRWAAAARRAALATAGRVLLFGGRPADAVFHADCGGRLSAAADVWGGSGYPYLRAQPDLGVAASAHQAWQYTTTLDDLATALAAAGVIPGGRRLTGLQVNARDISGRVTAIEFPGTGAPAATGAAVRTACSRAFGAQAVRSTLFSVSASGRQITFVGTGFGHGVGLCQVGAYARLQAGASVEDVLAFYYPATTLTGARPATRSWHTRRD